MCPEKVEDYSISKFQITLQLTSYCAMALTDFLTMCLEPGTLVFLIIAVLAIMMNIFSLAVLTWTLCEIADSQIAYRVLSEELCVRESVYSASTYSQVSIN